MLVYTDNTNINTKLSDDSLDTRTLIKLATWKFRRVYGMCLYMFIYTRKRSGSKHILC